MTITNPLKTLKNQWLFLFLQENPDCRRQYTKDSFFIGGNKGSVGDKERHKKRIEKKHQKTFWRKEMIPNKGFAVAPSPYPSLLFC